MKKLEKTLAIVFLIILATIWLPSCKKFVEIPPPQSKLVTTSVFANDATATSAQLAIYSQMVNNLESSSMAVNNGLLADELTNYEPGLINNQSFYTNALNVLNAQGTVGPWTRAYNYLYQSNVIIESLQNNGGVSPIVVKQLTGESLFVRAFWNFYLTNLYGDIPLVLSSDYAVTSKLSRTPRMEVLQQVIKDLSAARNLLSSKYVDASDTAVTIDRVRPNKAVAAALLARSYLYLGDYNNKDMASYRNAEAWADTVINNLSYSLINPLTSANYSFNISNNSEAIWQLATPLPATNAATQDGATFVLISQPKVALMGVSEICYTLFRGKTDHLFAGKEMQLML